MNRRSFFKWLGFGAAAVAAKPLEAIAIRPRYRVEVSDFRPPRPGECIYSGEVRNDWIESGGASCFPYGEITDAS